MQKMSWKAALIVTTLAVALLWYCRVEGKPSTRTPRTLVYSIYPNSKFYNPSRRAKTIKSRLSPIEQALSSNEYLRSDMQLPFIASPNDVKVFIGIFTAPSAHGVEPRSKADYDHRRELARTLWIPRALRYRHVAVRFVVGVNPDPVKHAHILAENSTFGDVMVLPVTDSYHSLTNKTKYYFAQVVKSYPAVEWVLKMDDDSFLLPERLLMAGDQWAAAGADYAGCFLASPVTYDFGHRWYEPNALQFGPSYPERALGPAYVLSARMIRRFLLPRFDYLRLSGSCEDSAVGAWMLSTNAAFLEDQRLCSIICNPAAVVMCDRAEQGLNQRFWYNISQDPGCIKQPRWPLPYFRPMKSWARRARLEGNVV